jgi:hypothetical protein
MKDATIDEASGEIVAEMGQEIKDFVEFVLSLGDEKDAEGAMLEKIEIKCIRTARRIGRILLSGGLRTLGSGRTGSAAVCECGGVARDKGDREHAVVTMLGDVRIRRAYYHCARCGRTFAPLDAKLGTGTGSVSTPVIKAVALLGSQMPFGRAKEVLQELTGVSISRRSVARRCVEAGRAAFASAPVEQKAGECAGKAVISMDACCINTLEGWKEVKCGTISASGEGTRYVAAMEEAKGFGLRMRKEFLSSSAGKAKEVIAVADGAKWIWKQVEINFPFRAHEVIDFWHASQQIWTCAQALWGEGSANARRWAEHYKGILWERGGAETLARLNRLRVRRSIKRKALRALSRYISNNLERMRYPQFREAGTPTSSGVIESACKQVVIERLRGAGMRWSRQGAQAVVTLRSLWLSGHWEHLNRILRHVS